LVNKSPLILKGEGLLKGSLQGVTPWGFLHRLLGKEKPEGFTHFVRFHFEGRLFPGCRVGF